MRSGLLMMLLSTVLLACPHNSKKGQDSTPPSSGKEQSTVVLKPAGKTLRVKVEVVSSDADRARGLMFRKEMAADSGMLFIFPREAIQSFWMKNTYIALDMIFISGEREVVGVVHSAEPMTTESRAVDRPSTYVLEVNGGFAKQHGIVEGTPVTFELTKN